jgi:NADH-quinone oxidoreductase subunit M
VLTLATIGILYGAIVASAQKDMKRLVAYSSLAQVGFIVLGTFAMNQQSLTGAVTMMVNHGIITAAFFMLIGWIGQRRGGWDTTILRGLQRPAPVLAAIFTVVMLASIGLPGLNGFVGEFLVLLGTFATHRWWGVVASFGVLVAAIYLLWNYQQVFHGDADHANDEMADLTTRERVVIAPLIVLIVVLGVYPKFMLDRIEPAVAKTVATVVNASPAPASHVVLPPSTRFGGDR